MAITQNFNYQKNRDKISINIDQDILLMHDTLSDHEQWQSHTGS